MSNANKIEFRKFPAILTPEYEELLWNILNKIADISSYDEKTKTGKINDTGLELLHRDINQLISDFQEHREAKLKSSAHLVKLNIEYCDAVLSGDKNFEIRYNDRAYQKGDFIRFVPIAETPEGKKEVFHKVENETYIITYVLPYYGLKEGYVALGIRKVEK